ncbi:sugar phosphate isomerase/epimerase family protein [Ruminococcus gauvreauii]|uniref:Sugar phosphate isomerase/epimerase n=1 Tax=Ruminococcus gauvreauii TaxID=438033 RepID=A0ABY5VBJ7_9FIRM|nr:sugar phosphate isomerase/epimerase [Ruminococcus gauvreauii]UWP57901.1 sugar phosphate isomerase/epimerase [Ruminococcus gauvreauii]
MYNVKIATAPCSWGVWYADGTPSGTPWELFLDQAAEAGYQALELGPDGYLPTDDGRLREELAKRSLEVCAGTACYQFDTGKDFDAFRPRVEALCRRLSALDVHHLVTMDESDVGKYSEKKVDMDAETWRTFFQKIKDMGEYTKNFFDIEVVYHPHIKTMVEYEEEIIRLMDFTGLRLCFDTGHHAYSNGTGMIGDRSAIDFMRRYSDRMAYLHFKQVDGTIYKKVMAEKLDSDTAFDMQVMCDIPDGIIDFEEVRRVMDEINYSGITVVESDMPCASNEQVFESAKRNLKYLQEIGIVK